VVYLFFGKVCPSRTNHIFILTTLRCTAIKLNRPRSVLSTSVEVPLPAPLQDLDRGQKFNNVLLQIAYARLIAIMDMVVDPEYVRQDNSPPLILTL
jgi:hypothetical protein